MGFLDSLIYLLHILQHCNNKTRFFKYFLLENDGAASAAQGVRRRGKSKRFKWQIFPIYKLLPNIGFPPNYLYVNDLGFVLSTCNRY